MMKEKKKEMSIKERKEIKKCLWEKNIYIYIHEFIKIKESELPGSLKCIRNLKSFKI
jgi:hypothetical protein